MRIKQKLKKNKLIRHIYKSMKDYRCGETNERLEFQNGIGNANIKIENIGWDKEIVYEIEMGGNSFGFFALYFRIINALAYADYLHMKPYVWCNKTISYSEEKELFGTHNAFEYYFSPLSAIKSVEDRYSVVKFHDKDVLYIKAGIVDETVTAYRYNDEQKRMYIERAAQISKKYIMFNERTEKLLNKAITDLLANKKTLGVHVRGGEWRKAVVNHPVAVTLEEYIAEVKNVVNEYKFEQIFLATDEKEAIDAFEKEFGERVVYYRDTFRGDNGQWLLRIDSNRENHNYKLGLEVLRDAETLVYCDGMIAGLSNISMYVEMRQSVVGRKPEYLHINNKGTNDTGRVLN